MQSTLDSIQNEISILENNIELELLNNDAKYIALLQIKIEINIMLTSIISDIRVIDPARLQ